MQVRSRSSVAISWEPQSDNETALNIQLPFAVTENGTPKL